MLAVCIHHDDHLATRCIQPGGQRIFLAKSAQLRQVKHLDVGRAQTLHDTGGVVLAAIVHHGQLDLG